MPIPVLPPPAASSGLLLFQVDALVFVAGDGGANLGRGLACLGHPVGEKAFPGAGVALGAVRCLVATAQASVPQRAVATAVRKSEFIMRFW